MSTFLKRLLLVLTLAAAVPLQGYAAGSVELCRAFAHEGGEVSTATAHGQHVAGDASTHHGAHGSPDRSPAQDSHHCAACASCGVAAAISAALAVHGCDASYRGVAVTAFPAPEGHVPDGLDRPPLTLLV